MIKIKSIAYLFITAIFLLLPALSSAGPAGKTALRQTEKADPFVNTDKKPYPQIAAGVALFQRYHDLAPGAQLMIRLYPRENAVKPADIRLVLQNASVRTPVILAPDLRFTPPEKPPAADSSELLSNQPDGSLLWYADIRTPGQPAGSRRLGDLRLECLVNLALNDRPVEQLRQNCVATAEVKCLDIWVECMSDTLAGMGGVVAGAFIPVSATAEPYEQKNRFRSVFIADKPLFGITLSHANKSMTLPSTYLYAGATQESIFADPAYKKPDLLGNFYELPLDNPLLPDDASVIFDYMDN